MATTKKMDLLSAVEQIVEKAKDSGLSAEFYRKADRQIKYVSGKMELTKEQSVMMALFIDNSDDDSISISQFGKFLGCRTTRIIRYMTDIDVLEKRELVRCSRCGHSISYRVPMEVIEAFKRNEKFVPKDCSGLSCRELFGEIEILFEMRNERELTFDALTEKMRHLFDCNRQLLYVQKVRSYNFDNNDEMMLILFSHLFVNNCDDNIGFSDINFLYDSRHLWRINKAMLEEGEHLMENSIQNIILQEMETLDGILIATTNLAQNMDKAFERRFLYKIKFEKPTVEARMSMWHEMIPSLKEDDSRALASKYDFSGGQIENIARHYTIGKILHGEPANVIEELSSYCDSERLETKEKRKIGF